ncbi:MAG: 6-phosphogluconolactonase [Myxococcota bacterium]
MAPSRPEAPAPGGVVGPGRLKLRTLPGPAALGRVAAEHFVRAARVAIAERGRFRVALAGGSTPRTLYRALARPDLARRVAWRRVEVFWGDERAVARDHADSNYRMVAETLLQHVDLPPDHVHPMPVECPDLDEAARTYQAEMAHIFGVAATEPPPSLDLVLLGLGTDGHTASLFPRSPALRCAREWVLPSDPPVSGPARLTLTLPILNQAARVLFLVSGGAKAEVLRRVLEEPAEPESLPAQGVVPVSGELLYLVDDAAASRLQGARSDCTQGPHAQWEWRP